MNDDVSMEINISPGQFSVAKQLMHRKNYNPAVLHLDFTIHRCSIGQIVIHSLKAFSFDRRLFLTTLGNLCLALDRSSVFAGNRRVVNGNYLPLYHRFDGMYGPVIYRTIWKFLRFFIKVGIKIVIVVSIRSIF